MPLLACSIGLLLIALGIASRLLSESGSITVLIPAFLGGLLLIAGLLARRPGARRHAMHAAAILALLGILGGAGAFVHVPALLAGGEVQRPLAVIARSLTCLLCAGLLAAAIRSFIVARRLRNAQRPA